MTFSVMQTKQLLAPIKPNRVLKDPRGNSHVSQQDVTAHLIRVFGFGNFSTELLGQELLYETVRPTSQLGETTIKGQKYNNSDLPHLWKYDVAYRATMRVTIWSDHTPLEDTTPWTERRIICQFEDSSTGDAQNQTRADAHDLALKSAISLAKKRCCINLGDQFGLSLYNKGQMAALVGGTLVLPEGFDKPAEDHQDLQDDVPQQEAMGVDETTHDDTAPTPEQEAALAHSVGVGGPGPVATQRDEGNRTVAMEDIAPDPVPDEPTSEGPSLVERAITASQQRDLERRRRQMHACFHEAKFTEPGRSAESKAVAREERLGYCASVLNHPVATSNDLTYEELEQVIAALQQIIASEKQEAGK